MHTIDIYLLLFLLTSGYALLLGRYKHLWEPDFTWLEVVVGVFFCLLAPYIDRQLNGPYTAEAYEWRIWQGFIVGSAPIIVWSVIRTVRAWQRISQRIWRRDGQSSAEALAGERRGRAERDD